jgi:hypothetical protein
VKESLNLLGILAKYKMKHNEPVDIGVIADEIRGHIKKEIEDSERITMFTRKIIEDIVDKA